MLHRNPMQTATKNQAPHVEVSALINEQGRSKTSLVYTLHTSSCLCVGYGLLGPSMGLALTGRRTRRSNLLPADLSFTPVT